MKQISKILLPILRPHIAVILLLTPLALGFTIFIFATQRETTVIGIISHVLSAYTLAVIIINMREIATMARWLVIHSRPSSAARAVIYKNKYTTLYMKDKAYRARVAIYAALGANLLFAVLRLLSGIYYASFWYGADAIFYILLSAVNLLILRFIRRTSLIKPGERGTRHLIDNRNMIDEYRLYRFCGCFLFALGAALIGLVFQIVYQNMAYEYPDVLIFAVATYAFACLVTAIVNVFSYRKLNSPVLSAAKSIRFARALVAIFALQTAMLNAFGDENFFDYQRLLNSLTGGGVCLFLFGMAVYMVRHANKNLKLLRADNSEAP